MTDHMSNADAEQAAHEIGRALAAGTLDLQRVAGLIADGYKHELEAKIEEETGIKYQPRKNDHLFRVMMALRNLSIWTNLEARQTGTMAVYEGADQKQCAVILGIPEKFLDWE